MSLQGNSSLISSCFPRSADLQPQDQRAKDCKNTLFLTVPLAPRLETNQSFYIMRIAD